MTYTFTPEQAAALADVEVDVTAHLAVKGEYGAACGCKRTTPKMSGHMECLRHGIQPVTLRQPVDLAALVEQRCETCGGRGKLPALAMFLQCGPPSHPTCPRCHDGRPLHTIQYECHANHLIDSHEPLCDESGLITLPGRWTYDALLPVVEEPESAYHDPDAISIDLLGNAWYGHRQITVCGTPEPGHFVLAVTRRTP